jgi:hypothetical protein
VGAALVRVVSDGDGACAKKKEEAAEVALHDAHEDGAGDDTEGVAWHEDASRTEVDDLRTRL